jgi:hypothetical protein
VGASGSDTCVTQLLHTCTATEEERELSDRCFDMLVTSPHFEPVGVVGAQRAVCGTMLGAVLG